MRTEKRKASKKIAVAACAALAIACAWTGGSIGLKGAANAEETATSGGSLESLENDGAFYAITGASVKLHSVTGDNSADYNGIRFSFEMSEAQYALIASSQNGTATFNEGVIVGAYVVPVSMLSGIEEGATPDAETIAAAAGAEHKEITADKWTKAASDAQADTQVYKSYLYVYDIPTENMDSDLACYAYLKSGETELKTAVQVRSMQYVAKASVDAGEHTAEELEKYLPEQSVTFKAEGLADSVEKVKYGESVAKPDSPVKDGYTFLNWVDKDGKTYDFSSAVKENITLTANFHENKYGVIDFSNYNELVQTDSVRLTYENTENSGKIIDINGEKAVSVKSNSKVPAAVVTGEKIKTFANFDYITAKVKYTVPSGSYVQVFMRGRYSSAPYTAATTSASDGWTFATIQTNLAQMKDLSTNGMVLWLYSPSEGLVGTDYIISEIRGGYNGITIEENPVNLTQKFGLEQNEFSATFTDIDGNKSEVADVTKFNSNVAGTLAVTVNKSGYAANTFSVNVTVLSEYNKVNFNHVTETTLGTITSQAGGDGVKLVTYDRFKVLTAYAEKTWYPTLTITSDEIKKIAQFDYFTVRVKTNAATSIVVFNVNNNNYSPDSTKNDGEWLLLTWKKSSNAAVYTMISQGKLAIRLNNGGGKTLEWGVAEITGGYDDISASETALDLTKKLGLAASDFTATFTPENGVEQAVENVAAVNISAAGTLKITVKKSGYAATVLTIGVKAAS